MAGIIYLLTNTINGKQYVGQTTSERFNGRMKTHKYPKRTNTRPLAHAVRKYGWQTFRVEILETCIESQTDERECFHISTKQSLHPQGYNMTSGGERGKAYTIATRQKMSRLKKTYLQRNPEKLAEFKRAALRGACKPSSIEQVQKFVQSCSRDWLVTFPDGHTEAIHNLSEFCRAHNLNRGTMSMVASGKFVQHKNYKCARLGSNHYKRG